MVASQWTSAPAAKRPPAPAVCGDAAPRTPGTGAHELLRTDQADAERIDGRGRRREERLGVVDRELDHGRRIVAEAVELRHRGGDLPPAPDQASAARASGASACATSSAAAVRSTTSAAVHHRSGRSTS